MFTSQDQDFQHDHISEHVSNILCFNKLQIQA